MKRLWPAQGTKEDSAVESMDVVGREGKVRGTRPGDVTLEGTQGWLWGWEGH